MVHRISTRRIRYRTAQYEEAESQTKEDVLKAKRDAYNQAKKEYEEALLKKEGKPSFAKEFGTAVGTALRGGIEVGKVAGKVAQAFGENLEEDLYRRSPQGRADRAILAAMQEKGKVRSSRGSTASKRKERLMLVELEGKEILIPKSKVTPILRSRGRR